MLPILFGFLVTLIFAIFARDWRPPLIYVILVGTFEYFLKVRRRRLAARLERTSLPGPRLAYTNPKVQATDQSAHEETVNR